MYGSLVAISKRYNVIQPITAGYDSRVLLAASKPIRNKIKYYTFKTDLTKNSPDLMIPQRLSNHLDLNYMSIDTEESEQRIFGYIFKGAYQSENCCLKLGIYNITTIIIGIEI